MRNRPCPACRSLGRDKDGDHLFLMEDGETWCCNKTEIHPTYLEGKPVAQLDNKEVVKSIEFTGRLHINEIKKLPIVENKDRLISVDTMSHYKVRSEFHEEDASLRALYYPETAGLTFSGYKCRTMPKSFMTITREGYKGTTPDLFGQFCSPRTGMKIIVCAGEEDTLAAYEMLHTYKPDWTWAVVGLPRGESGVAPVAENIEFLNGFDEIVIAMDMDDAGKKAVDKLVPVVGEKSRILFISEKDISDMLVKGKSKEFINAYFKAKEYRPANVVSIGDILEDAITPVQWGLSYPWKKLTKLTYGMKKDRGEIVGVGAAPGAGKSTIWQMIQRHLMFEHKEPIAVFDIEEGSTQGLKKLIGSCMNLPIHKPDCEYDIDKAREIGKSFNGLANFYGGDSENWDEVEDAIRYYASKGISYYFIDPISALVEHLSASDGNQELGRIMRSMRKFRKNQCLTFFHANHLNNPSSGKEHGEGGAVRGSQFSGSRAQWKYSTLLLGFERDQYADDPEERDVGMLRVLKDRLGGNTGVVNMKYKQATGTLEEVVINEF